jgi:hypothetical protein
MVTAMIVLTVAFSTNHSGSNMKVEKCKVVPIDSVKSHTGRREIALLILNLDTRRR